MGGFHYQLNCYDLYLDPYPHYLKIHDYAKIMVLLNKLTDQIYIYFTERKFISLPIGAEAYL